MPEETNINPTPPSLTPSDASPAPVTPIETPTTTPVAPAEPIPAPLVAEPAPPIITPEPVAPPATPVAPVAPPTPAAPPPPVAESPIRSLLSKALAKIRFRKQAKLEKIMVLARQQGKITNDDAQKLLRISDATATRYLSELVKTGRLQMVGHPRNASYKPLP